MSYFPTDDIKTETDKIDSAATDGLLGTSNSLSYRVHEIERHLHSGARWFGVAGTPSATHFGDRIGTTSTPYEVDGGNDTWGDWTQLLGTDDTPAITGKTHYDPHLLVITATENSSIYFIQFARGATGAAGLTAGTYTELALDLTSKAGGVIIPVQTGRAPVDSLLWCRVWSVGDNTGWIKFFMGMHEYEG